MCLMLRITGYGQYQRLAEVVSYSSMLQQVFHAMLRRKMGVFLVYLIFHAHKYTKTEKDQTKWTKQKKIEIGWCIVSHACMFRAFS